MFWHMHGNDDSPLKCPSLNAICFKNRLYLNILASFCLILILSDLVRILINVSWLIKIEIKPIRLSHIFPDYIWLKPIQGILNNLEKWKEISLSKTCKNI